MTIREYTLKLLEDCECKNSAYEDTSVETALHDLEQYVADGNTLGFPIADVAKELVLIGNHEHLEPVPVHDLSDLFDDWGRWGISDCAPESEKILRGALKDDEKFDTGWHGWAKTEGSMRIEKSYDGITVGCANSMDSALEQYDLFSDFLTNEELERLDDDTVDQIRNMLYDGDFVEEVTYYDMLPVTASFEEIMAKATELMQDCDDKLTESFHECIGDTLWVLYHDKMPEKELFDLISDRIEERNA